MRRRPHKDPVTPAVRQEVLTRDGWRCIAPRIDRNQIGPCSGELTLDHVKSRPRFGVRAESDPQHLVTVCDGHSERGARAGYQWNTSSRDLERAWLRRFYPDPDEQEAGS